ncbi:MULTISPECIES: lysophospholipid acyltransferase family protein [Acidithiobacillus]|uniref:Lipid A biosynthesis acyltransferase n=2 Tax=Acidithiobacillus TaxID=119977 RepID=A0A179BG55_ACIFR|nr:MULTISPECIES: lysophospholipid acyltransferase family protein [Acidithiobacillus]MEB8486253.1 lysophospholipid acyltransferase family protein [Acidithiobacillus ferriphilus]MEB8488894.1 lysophospholipid acyltransferase family protein [Acidithiobacillus ferriphilus]MEB8493741.1 lysophospholipid acyltransferase family protein [Acidithiobacillus ferriphilus]MEB8513372.1 lysophospholipid acyltransferase family protein [Acidithiobacillus ferriphilus]MEB8520941.1 lysophospholipid acyltransferase 
MGGFIKDAGTRGQRLGTFIVKWLLQWTARWPDTWRSRCGGGLGLIAMAALPKIRRVVDINLKIAFPDWSLARRQQLRRQNFCELGRTTLELGPIWARPLPGALNMVRAVEGAEAVDHALALGHGVILFTAHLGPWEAAVLYTGQRWPITGMYRALRNPCMDALMRHCRERSGARQLNKERGIRPLFRVLKKKEIIGILTDQNVDPREGVFAPFFGYPACTTPVLGRLAARDRVPVFGMFAYRLPQGSGFRIEFVPLPDTFPSGDAVADATVMNDCMETAIRKAPEQYWWVHRRFKDQPAARERPY